MLDSSGWFSMLDSSGWFSMLVSDSFDVIPMWSVSSSQLPNSSLSGHHSVSRRAEYRLIWLTCALKRRQSRFLRKQGKSSTALGDTLRYTWYEPTNRGMNFFVVFLVFRHQEMRTSSPFLKVGSAFR
jgi:hypothetical protein